MDIISVLKGVFDTTYDMACTPRKDPMGEALICREKHAASGQPRTLSLLATVASNVPQRVCVQTSADYEREQFDCHDEMPRGYDLSCYEVKDAHTPYVVCRPRQHYALNVAFSPQHDGGVRIHLNNPAYPREMTREMISLLNFLNQPKDVIYAPPWF